MLEGDIAESKGRISLLENAGLVCLRKRRHDDCEMNWCLRRYLETQLVFIDKSVLLRSMMRIYRSFNEEKR
jgi:hypothetical protein